MLINQKEKVKIVYVITKSSWGGAGVYVYDLATNLSQNRFDITVISGGEGVLVEKLREKGITTIQIPELQRDVAIIKEFKVLNILRHHFEELKPDIIHLNSTKVGGTGSLAARFAKVPKIIFTAHGWPFNEDRNFIWKLALYITSWVTVLLSHVVITLSYKEETQALSFPFLSSKKIRMVYMGLAGKEYLSKEDARRYIQGVNKKTPSASALWIGSIGELHKNKGYIHALQMCKILKENGKDFFYFIIGEGEEHNALLKYIDENDLSENVALLGAIPDPTSGSILLKAFDVFLFPSTKEGLPYVLLEAGLAETPVVATTVGGIPEIITHKESGLLAGDIEGEVFASLVESIMYDERIRNDYSTKLKQQVSFKFTFKNMIQDTKNIYLN